MGRKFSPYFAALTLFLILLGAGLFSLRQLEIAQDQNLQEQRAEAARSHAEIEARQKRDEIMRFCETRRAREALERRYSVKEASHRLFRFNADGSLDSTFATLDLNSDSGLEGQRIFPYLRELPDGYLLFGYRPHGTEATRAAAITKLGPNGTPDRAFARNLATWLNELYQPLAYVQPSGKILVSAVRAHGFNCTDNPDTSHLDTWPTLVRIEPNGKRDPVFTAREFPSSGGPFELLMLENGAFLWFQRDGLNARVRQWTADGEPTPGEAAGWTHRRAWQPAHPAPSDLLRFARLQPPSVRGGEFQVDDFAAWFAPAESPTELIDAWPIADRKLLLHWNSNQKGPNAVPPQTVVDANGTRDPVWEKNLFSQLPPTFGTEFRFEPYGKDATIILDLAPTQRRTPFPYNADAVIMPRQGQPRTVTFATPPGSPTSDPAQVLVGADGKFLVILKLR